MSVLLLWQSFGVLVSLLLYPSMMFVLDSHLGVATWPQIIGFNFFFSAGPPYCIVISKWDDILSKECPPEGEEHLCSFLVPNMSQKNIYFSWKIKIVELAFLFSQLPLPCPAPMAVSNCWEWGHCQSPLNCLGLRMEVMWSACSHRVAPDPSPQPLGNKTIWKVFSCVPLPPRPTKWNYVIE